MLNGLSSSAIVTVQPSQPLLLVIHDIAPSNDDHTDPTNVCASHWAVHPTIHTNTPSQ